MTRHSVEKGATASGYAIILATISAALFGAATPASKWLLGEFSSFQLAGLLYLGAALGVAPVAFRGRSPLWPWKLNRRNLRLLLGAILCGGILGPVLLLFGLRLASAASVSMWLNLELVATALLGRLIFRDYLGKFGWIGVAGVVLAGVILSAGEGGAGIRAGLLVAAACCCWGLDNHFTSLIDGITPSQSTFWKSSVAGSVNLVIGISLTTFDGTLTGAGAALIVGALCYGVSITLYIASAQQLGATRSQMVFASAPFFGVLLSALFLSEIISLAQIVAALLLVGSLAVLFLDQHTHYHEHGPSDHEHWHRHDDGHHDHTHPDRTPGLKHSHPHRHEPIGHSHPHWPDLHHRHGHEHRDRDQSDTDSDSG